MSTLDNVLRSSGQMKPTGTDNSLASLTARNPRGRGRAYIPIKSRENAELLGKMSPT